jgi:hypothetical protein
MSSLLQATTALPPGIKPQLSAEKETEWDQEMDWKLWKLEACRESNPNSQSFSP